MKYCATCSKLLDDNVKFCMVCGAEAETLQIPSEAIPENVTRKFCGHCGTQLEVEAAFCSACGEPCDKPEGYEQFDKFQETSSHTEQPTIKPLVLCLLAICAILWFAAPFIAINLFTFGNQPTALQFLTDDILYLGDLTETTAYWAAIVSLIGIIVCFICAIRKKHTATSVIAVLTEIPLTIALFESFSWVDDFEELFDALGIGFWGLFILLFVVMLASRSKE